MAAAVDLGGFEKEILPILAPGVKRVFLRAGGDMLLGIEEIRMRCGQPLMIRTAEKELAVGAGGGFTSNTARSYVVTREDIMRTIAAISDNSLYAFEEDIRKGFITISGGHRVGLAGQVVMDNGEIKSIKDFSSVCIRIAREVRGCAGEVMRSTGFSANKLENTLLVSAPRCGKTTLLRDMARQISTGSKNLKARNVVIVDERSEIAGSYLGIPQMDVGPRTDVLDGCPKAYGMIMAVRAMSPEVIITDEIGRREDVEAVQECINAGVSIISSVHAGNLEELQKRPIMKDLMAVKAFKNVVLLSRRRGPGSIEKIVRWD